MFNYKLYGNLPDYKQLSKKKQIELVKLWRRNRSMKVMDQLIMSNFKFIIFMAEKYMNRGLPMNDLITLSYMGFRTAIDRYRYKFNKSLVNYSIYHIRNLINSSLIKEYSLIQMPGNMWKPLHIIQNMMSSHNTDNEMMNELNVTARQLAKLKFHCQAFDTNNRLGIILFNDEDCQYDVGCEDVEHVKMENDDEKIAVNNIVNTVLNEKQHNIIVRRYGLNGNPSMSLRQLALIYGCTGERIRQLEMKALNKIRKHLEGKRK